MISKINWLASNPVTIAPQACARSIHLWRFSYTKQDRHQPFLDILSAYTGLPINATHVHRSAYGKPYLRHPRISSIAFNWSHSRQTAVMAIAIEPLPLGVDIEHIGRSRPCLALARRYFTLTEQHALAQRDGIARQDYFIRLWNAKEALLKAHGRGIAYGLDKISITCHDDGLGIDRLEGPIAQQKPWHLAQYVLPDTGYVALAWSGSDRAIKCFTWNNTR